MDIKKLEDITQSWEDIKDIHMMNKEAGVLADLKSFVTGGGKALWEIGKSAVFAAPVIGGLGAIWYNQLNTPKMLADNVDKELLDVTLDKEIAVWERYIKDEEERRAHDAALGKKYDRFV